MDAGGRYVLVPLSVGSLATGLLQSLATPWGPFRHNWVVAKLTINVFASLVLLLYLQTLAALADVARRTAVDGAGLDQLRSPSPTIDAVGAIVLLVSAAGFSVYKPRGLARHGRRKQREALAAEG